ncbi:MAG TPA: SCO family protein [Verrucomicrobiae bacterium]
MRLDMVHRFAYVTAFVAVALFVTACDPPPPTVPAVTAPPAPTKPTIAKPTVARVKDPLPGATNIFEVKGVVQQLRPNGTTAVIRHEEIPGYMEAMTMPLSVKSTNDLAGVAVGDTISFRMLVTHDDGWIDQVQVLGHTNTPPVPPPTTRLVRNVDVLKLGDKLPDYPFINEFGKGVRTDEFRGKAVALTFMFTRCPFPNFCPRLTDNFKRAYQKLEEDTTAPKNWHLLSLSFDVQMDTPEVLRAYAQRTHYKPEKWSFLTGALIEIDDIGERFGMVFSREDGTFNFNHNMRTVVIDTRGRVYSIFIGNEWKVDELVAKLKEAALVPATGEAPPVPIPPNAAE